MQDAGCDAVKFPLTVDIGGNTFPAPETRIGERVFLQKIEFPLHLGAPCPWPTHPPIVPRLVLVARRPVRRFPRPLIQRRVRRRRRKTDLTRHRQFHPHHPLHPPHHRLQGRPHHHLRPLHRRPHLVHRRVAVTAAVGVGSVRIRCVILMVRFRLLPGIWRMRGLGSHGVTPAVTVTNSSIRRMGPTAAAGE